LPQEEKLEIARHKGTFIGIQMKLVIKSVYLHQMLNSLTSNGHRVMIESERENSSYSDKEYSDAGAEVTRDNVLVVP
jgi:alanine dehydrogenase